MQELVPKFRFGGYIIGSLAFGILRDFKPLYIVYLAQSICIISSFGLLMLFEKTAPVILTVSALRGVFWGGGVHLDNIASSFTSINYIEKVVSSLQFVNHGLFCFYTFHVKWLNSLLLFYFLS